MEDEGWQVIVYDDQNRRTDIIPLRPETIPDYLSTMTLYFGWVIRACARHLVILVPPENANDTPPLLGNRVVCRGPGKHREDLE